MNKTYVVQVLILVLVCGTFSPRVFAITEAAKVNDKVITLEDVNTHLAEAARANPVVPPTRKMILDELIKREAALQEAHKMHLDQDPAVNDRMNTVLFFAYIEKKLQPEFDKMTISDAEAKSWYEKNPEIRTSHIFVALPAEASSDDERAASKKLSETLSEIKSGKMSFAEAAQKYSEDPSSSVGGDLEYRMKDRLDPNYYKAAVKLGKAGDITGPVRSAYGLHLIRLTGKRGWNEIDRLRVKRIILDERREELVSRLLNGLRQKASVTVNEKVIKE
jgi:peptidyl-prolyl cis-trans isomerase C/peptidyl-prolyl cis-trans isomerase D